MTYTLGVPFDGQSLANSKPQIRSNFTVINTDFAVNHIAFGSTGEGKHKFLQMPEQGAAPVTGANEGGLYTKEAQTITNLFWRQESNGTEVQMTNIAPTNASTGATFLPGGLLIQWGSVSLGGPNSSTTATYTYQFTSAGVAVIPYSVQVTPNGSLFNTTLLTLAVGGFDATNRTFQIRRSGGQGGAGAVDGYFIVIGPRT